MTSSTTVFQFLQHSIVYNKLVDQVSTDKSFSVGKLPKIPSFTKLKQTKENTKMFSFNEGKLTTTKSKQLIEKVIRKMYSTTDLAVYSAHEEIFFTFRKLVIRKFPVLEEEIPN